MSQSVQSGSPDTNHICSSACHHITQASATAWLLQLGQCAFTATIMDVVVQMYGPDVAPLTIGKQNLVMYVLRQLEKHFVVANQFFRLKDCSHNTDQQSASLSLTIVTHTGITDVGLDTVSSHLSSAFSRYRPSCCSALRPYLQLKLLCV